jgi:trehalose synthase
VEEYDTAIFTLKEFIPSDLTISKVHVVHPAIDPLNLKNIRLSMGQSRQITENFTVDPRRPILLQVSRFDMWKDPFGVIDVYRLVKQEFPELQLALVGSMASDDPEGWEYFCRVVNYAEGDDHINTLVNLGEIEVNALQRTASVIIQKSIREAFGLVVSEALWKRKPVVAGRVGGIPLQIQDGENGFLAKKTEEYAAAISLLLNDSDLRKQMGNKAHEWVKQRFLITRLLENYLDIMSE